MIAKMGTVDNQQWWNEYAGHCAVVRMFHRLMHMLMTSEIVCIHIDGFRDVATSEQWTLTCFFRC
jgi:hypothetical protein